MGPATAASAATQAKILVALQLSGGNDGINTLVPYGQQSYYDLRPTLAIPADSVLPLTDKVGLHPELTALKDLFDAGHLAVIQGVGYPNPNRSHFRSMDIWHTARPESFELSGWPRSSPVISARACSVSNWVVSTPTRPKRIPTRS